MESLKKEFLFGRSKTLGALNGAKADTWEWGNQFTLFCNFKITKNLIFNIIFKKKLQLVCSKIVNQIYKIDIAYFKTFEFGTKPIYLQKTIN